MRQISPDGRNRRLQYPNVPDVLPKTLDNLVSLQSFYISGNTSVPGKPLLFLTTKAKLSIQLASSHLACCRYQT